MVASVLQLAGLAALAVAAGLWNRDLGIAVAGLAALIVGLALELR